MLFSKFHIKILPMANALHAKKDRTDDNHKLGESLEEFIEVISGDKSIL